MQIALFCFLITNEQYSCRISFDVNYIYIIIHTHMHVYMVWLMRYNLIKIQLEKKSDIKEKLEKSHRRADNWYHLSRVSKTSLLLAIIAFNSLLLKLALWNLVSRIIIIWYILLSSWETLSVRTWDKSRPTNCIPRVDYTPLNLMK